ncbi:MAG: FAD:protein FMN transferase [Patescibacteria group bacterium]|jgi:thiamine biosynthesis lipoprotein
MIERFEFDAIGTHWTVDILGEITSDALTELKRRIAERIETFDQTYSRFRDDSLVTQIAKKEGVYAFPRDAKPLFALYEQVYRSTNGHVTPLIGQVLVDAGYDAQYSLVEGTLTSPPPWEDVMKFDPSNNHLVVMHPGVLLDFGAAGKGYLIDIVGELIEREGFPAYMINAGGDIRHRGAEAIRVGLEHPDRLDMVIGTVLIQNQSICGSAGNRRTWGRFHHIIDPFKLESPRHIIAIWTLASSTLLADAMTTAFMFADADVLRREYPVGYLIMYADYTFKYSFGFEPGIFAE